MVFWMTTWRWPDCLVLYIVHFDLFINDYLFFISCFTFILFCLNLISCFQVISSVSFHAFPSFLSLDLLHAHCFRILMQYPLKFSHLNESWLDGGVGGLKLISWYVTFLYTWETNEALSSTFKSLQFRNISQVLNCFEWVLLVVEHLWYNEF